MPKKYNIILHEKFEKSLLECLNYLKDFNYEYSQRVKYDVHQSLKLLEFFPNMFSSFKNPYNNQIYRRMIIDEYYLVIYRVKEPFVHIILFVDGRQAYYNYFKSLS